MLSAYKEGKRDPADYTAGGAIPKRQFSLPFVFQGEETGGSNGRLTQKEAFGSMNRALLFVFGKIREDFTVIWMAVWSTAS